MKSKDSKIENKLFSTLTTVKDSNKMVYNLC